MTTEVIQYKPASSLAVLDRLERGGADAAAHACWNSENCSDDDLDGLLTAHSDQPRAVWWAYKAYTDGVSSRVASASSSSRFVALASRSAQASASATPVPQVIVGMYQVKDGSDTGAATLVFNHLSGVVSVAGATILHLTVQTIPATEGDALPNLPPTTTLNVPVQNDSSDCDSACQSGGSQRHQSFSGLGSISRRTATPIIKGITRRTGNQTGPYQAIGTRK